MHHKRGRDRNRRAGCKLCKFWKVNHFRKGRIESEKFSDHKRRKFADVEAALADPKGRWVCVDCRRTVYHCPDPACKEENAGKGVWHHEPGDNDPVRECFAGESMDASQIEFVEGDAE